MQIYSDPSRRRSIDIDRLPDPVTLHGYPFSFEWIRCGKISNALSPGNKTCYEPFHLVKTRKIDGRKDGGIPTRVGFCRTHGAPFSAEVIIKLERIASDRRASQDASEARNEQIRKNERIMAAAPALLEAAQTMYELHKDGVSHQLQARQRAAALTALRDAIAAATGEEKN